MLERVVLFLSLGLFINGCSGWSSELKTAKIGDQQKSTQPVCQFEATNNCYSKSMELLMSCVQPVTVNAELISDQFDSCSNDSGKLVLFQNSLAMVEDFETEVIEFKVRNGQKTCFRFVGNAANFIIDQTGFGQVQVNTLADGDIKVSCLFGDGFVIPAEAKTLGCQGEKAAVEEFLPGNRWSVQKQALESGEEVFDHFEFLFLGTGVPRQPVFKCHL